MLRRNKMEKINYKKLSTFKKIIFILGWFNVLSIVFWVAMVIYHIVTKEKKFFTPGSYRVVYIFGWITFISLIVFLISNILGIFLFRNIFSPIS